MDAASKTYDLLAELLALDSPGGAQLHPGSIGVEPACLGPGDWLIPPLPLAQLGNRLGNITGAKAKAVLAPFGLREWPPGNRQSFTIRLDLLPTRTADQLRGIMRLKTDRSSRQLAATHGK